MNNPRSTASLAGHPIHPMLVNFPIAFFVGALVCDFLFWRSNDPFWSEASFWLLSAGLLMAALAAVAGLIDFFGDPQIRAMPDAHWHAGGNVVAVLIQLVNWYVRYRSGASVVVPLGLSLSLIVVCILLFTGWKGWKLVYLHRVGVADENSFEAPPPRRR